MSTAFIVIGALATLLTIWVVAWPLMRGSGDERRAPVSAALSALVIPLAVLATYALVSDYPWPAPRTLPDDPAARELASAVGTLERQLAAAPENPDAWVRLGEGYVQLGRYPEAERAYYEAVQLTGGNRADALLGLAETRVLQDRGALSGDAGRVIELVLAQQPDNPKALWYGGLAALARGAAGEARVRWQRLLDQQPPARLREVLQAQIAALPAGDGTAIAGPRVALTVNIDPALAGRIAPGAPLFVIARSPGQGGPPVAVLRRPAGEFPLSVELSDANVMLPGRSLADLEQLELIARVANGGDATSRPGDLYGELRMDAASLGNGPHALTIDRVVAP